MSETSRHRDKFKPYTQGMGLDIGYGGAPIHGRAITVDLPQKYVDFEGKPQHLYGNAENLYWFRDGVLDFCYSSHLIEDFEDTQAILLEWLRVIKPHGYLCLLFPDEKRYREITPQEYWNRSHKHMDMGLNFMLDVIKGIITTGTYLDIVEAKKLFEGNDYNCMVVCRKDY